MEINPVLHYLLIFILLFSGMFAYFKLAGKYRIIDKPNQRSSHDYITIRGGGIVFSLAGILYSLNHLPGNIYFMAGLILISAVSFWDDISDLSALTRVITHFISIGLVFFGLGMYSALPWWLILIAYIFVIGVLNAYNFMDGINGITGLYSLGVLTCLLYVNQKIVQFTTPDFIYYAMIACLVFLFFNFRKKARCFAGDIGSMAISFWIVTLLLQLMMETHSVVWILFLSVYGVDSVCTIIHRMYLKQNIFKAHRLHFYQILSNECGISHRIVAMLYALVQVVVCILIIYFFNHKVVWELAGCTTILISLLLIYSCKFRLIKEKNSHTVSF